MEAPSEVDAGVPRLWLEVRSEGRPEFISEMSAEDF